MICERAKLKPSTFHDQFADKDELLVSVYDDLPGTLKRIDDKPFAFLSDLVAQVRTFYPLTRALRKRTSQEVVPRLRTVVFDLVLLDLEPHRAHASEAERDTTAHFLAGAIVDSLIWWLDEGPALDAGAIEARLRGMCAAVLAELGTPSRATLPEFAPPRRR